MVSVTTVEVPTVVRVCTGPTTGVPDVTVVLVKFTTPLVPVYGKPPVPPLLMVLTVRVGSLLWVKVQAILGEPVVASASSVTVPVTRFGVAV
ncbi:hypothetical protein FG002_022345, partial [Chitinimonas sp. BJB300]